MSEAFDRALATGIKTETDGMKMYQDAAKKAKNALGKALFESLVADERNHLTALKKRVGEAWKRPTGTPLERIRTVFQDVAKDIKERMAADPGDVEAIRIALDFERRGYHMYKDAALQVAEPEGRELLEWLAGEENQHFKILQDLLEYLEKNYSWFVANEGPILDGGS